MIDKETKDAQSVIVNAIYESNESPKDVMPRVIRSVLTFDPELASRLDECWEHTVTLANEFNNAPRRRRAHLRASLVALGIRTRKNG